MGEEEITGDGEDNRRGDARSGRMGGRTGERMEGRMGGRRMGGRKQVEQGDGTCGPPRGQRSLVVLFRKPPARTREVGRPTRDRTAAC